MTILSLSLAGTPRTMGRQHGTQIAHLREHLLRVIAARLNGIRRLDADRASVVRPCLDLLTALDQPLLEYMAGIAESLDIDSEQLMLYTLSSYLRDVATGRALHGAGRNSAPGTSTPSDGCTTWAASGRTTSSSRPLLAKNRDYHADHIELQVLARVEPAEGYRYLSLGSAGSPEVFSSGINERGLAVADTHVLSHDIGPGLPRFSLMRELLLHHDSVASALEFLRSVPHMGAGTLTMADATGELGVCESGHVRSGYVAGSSGIPLVSTNHFTTPDLANQWIEDEPTLLQGNSPARRRRVLQALAEDAGAIDVAWAQRMMSAHGTPLDAICRHPLAVDGAIQAGLDGSTISSVIFEPDGSTEHEGPGVWLAVGPPCQANWRYLPVVQTPHFEVR